MGIRRHQIVMRFVLSFALLFSLAASFADAQCVLTPAALRDNFNRPDGALPGSNRWVLLLNQPGSGSLSIVGNAVQATNSLGSTNYGGAAWDSLLNAGSEMSFRVAQKSGNYSYAGLFLYVRMNNKDYSTGRGYRLRYLEQSGADLLQIQRVGPGYANAVVLASVSHEVNPGDILAFRVLCDNQTMAVLVNGTQVLTAKDAAYTPAQWYAAVRTCVFPVPFRADDFMVSPQSVTPPPAPALISPSNGSTGQPATMTLAWNTSLGATAYHLQLATDSLFASKTIDDSTLTTTSRTVGPLAAGSKYFWRVCGKNNVGSGPYSAVSAFTVIAVPPVPLLVSPANGAVGQGSLPTLTWNASTGATSYRLQLASDSAFGHIVLNDSTVAATSRVVGPLSPGATCYWRVSAQNAAGASTFSSAWKFVTASQSDTSVHHYEYVFVNGWIYVYDIDNGHALVRSISVPTSTAIRGATVSPIDGMLYISFGGDGGGYGNGSMLQYNLVRDSIGWIRNYAHGIDSHAMTPDGKTIYMPDGELSTDGNWYIVRASDGIETGMITPHGQSPHNTVVSLNGAHVYLGDRDINSVGNDSFYVASTATNQVIRSIGPMLSGVRPFTINGTETFAFVEITRLLGFQVVDLVNGTVPYTVDLTTMGFPNPVCVNGNCQTAPSHGISLSPDERELYVVDNRNSYVHVFDVSGIAQHIAPVKVADIPLQTPFAGSDSNCVYDCVKSGWAHHSRDGRYVYVGQSGDVISTASRTIVANLPALKNSRVMLEVDWKNGLPIATSTRTGMGYVTTVTQPSAPALVSPAKDTTLQSTTVTLGWNAVPTATTYRAQLSTDSLFASVLLDDSTVAALQRQVTSLPINVKLYWHVSASNAAGSSAYSQRWSFTVVPAPVVPQLLAPANAASCQPASLTLSWSAVTGATSYRVQVAVDSLFTSRVVDDSTIVSTSRLVSGLSANTAYSWRVSAKTAAGWSAFSARRSFATFPASTLRDDFNRPDGPLAGSNKWALILNQPSGGSMSIVSGAIQPVSSAGNGNFGGVAWDSVCTAGSEISATLRQKSGDFSYTSFFLYAKMSSKDYATATGYRLRYFEQSGTDILEIHRVGPGYANSVTIGSTAKELNVNDVLTFRVLCDNRTLVALVNGTQVLSIVDSAYLPSQWYFAIRACVWTTAVRLGSFAISPAKVVPSVAAHVEVPGSEIAAPREFRLEQNYPNPFNPGTTIQYQLPTASRVSLRIYNVLGAVVSELADEVQDAGFKQVEWDASSFASGIYFYRMEATSVTDPSRTFTSVKKMLLMK